MPTSELEYLGFSFVGSRATINVSSKSIERFKHRIREITGRRGGISMERRVRELQRFVRGWMGYYGIASQLKRFARLEQWIRRRIRCCYWKRWRHVRTRVRELITLGVSRRQAIRHGKSRKGPWHMSKTIASGVGLANAWLAEQGVLSLTTLWAEHAHLCPTAGCGLSRPVVWGGRSATAGLTRFRPAIMAFPRWQYPRTILGHTLCDVAQFPNKTCCRQFAKQHLVQYWSQSRS